MKILITSGGTKVKIDLVRSITNMSRGTFGSKICDAFWNKIIDSHKKSRSIKKECAWQESADITFFYHKDSKLPNAEKRCNELYDTSFRKIEYVPYDTFDDYRNDLKKLVLENHYDIIVLAAAVSDYRVKECYNGKYRSGDDMTIKLVKLPKVIKEIREIVPKSTVICGFKLLVNSTERELEDAMMKQFKDNDIDLVVGNDLRDIKADNHKLTLKTRYSEYFRIYEKKNHDLAKVVVDECLECLTYKKKEFGDEVNDTF